MMMMSNDSDVGVQGLFIRLIFLVLVLVEAQFSNWNLKVVGRSDWKSRSRSTAKPQTKTASGQYRYDGGKNSYFSSLFLLFFPLSP